MTIFQFILAALACYRISVLFARDAGPFKLFKKLRAVPHVGHMTGCVFCNSIYIGAAMEVAFLFSGITDPPVVCVLIALALSAVAIALDRTFSSDYQT